MPIPMRQLPTTAHRRSGRGPALALSLLLALGGLAGCASKNPLIDAPASGASADPESGVQTVKNRRLFGILSPYRVDIQQGNFVSREMLAQLKPGMTREQVRFALGTPLLTDIFHADRWDYPFRLQKNNGELITSRVTIFFKDNVVDRFEGGNLPSEAEYLSRLTGKPLPDKISPAVAKPPSSAAPVGTTDLPPVR